MANLGPREQGCSGATRFEAGPAEQILLAVRPDAIDRTVNWIPALPVVTLSRRVDAPNFPKEAQLF
jgi:hypothetical protein